MGRGNPEKVRPFQHTNSDHQLQGKTSWNRIDNSSFYNKCLCIFISLTHFLSFPVLPEGCCQKLKIAIFSKLKLYANRFVCLPPNLTPSTIAAKKAPTVKYSQVMDSCNTHKIPNEEVVPKRCCFLLGQCRFYVLYSYVMLLLSIYQLYIINSRKRLIGLHFEIYHSTHCSYNCNSRETKFVKPKIIAVFIFLRKLPQQYNLIFRVRQVSWAHCT